MDDNFFDRFETVTEFENISPKIADGRTKRNGNQEERERRKIPLEKGVKAKNGLMEKGIVTLRSRSGV